MLENVTAILHIDDKERNWNIQQYRKLRDFPGGPVVKNLPSNAGDAGWSLVGELRSHMLRGN